MTDNDWYRLSVTEVAEKLNTNPERGLLPKEAVNRLSECGENELTEKKRRSALILLLEQFNDFLIWILIASALIAGFILGEIIDASAIVVILVLNAVLGFVQTYRAEKALEALKELSAPIATVIRENIIEISAKGLVPGDVILLESGDKIPADCRLIEAVNFATQEAGLTGESGTVSKTIEPVEKVQSIGDWKNFVFAGTSVARGRAKAIAVATGDNTQIGKIAGLIQQPEHKTPLQLQLKRASIIIGIAVIFLSLIVFAAGFIKGIAVPVIFLASVSLAVAAIPEGLPAVITITLALGVQNMARKHAIVRRLHAVETLGATNYICSDKTGTITMNKMQVKQIYISDNLFDFERDKIARIAASAPKEMSLLMRIAALANDARVVGKGQFAGDPTETSLVEAALIAGFSKTELEEQNPRVDEIPFESERKMMTTVNLDNEEKVAFSKGASEVILGKCQRIITGGEVKPLSAEEKSKILKINDELTSRGYRVLGFSYRKVKPQYEIDKIEEDMVFVGLTALIDPPREEVKASIAEALAAGINISMITGDHVNTATSIAKQIGLLDNRRVLSGKELEKMSTHELAEIVEEVAVYARVNPVDKVKIVHALKERGHIVAMTGDGVNDAPALKSADVGVAMGITGTDVSKESADMVLADDNFATIIRAVREGRVIFDNLVKFTDFLLSINVSIVLTLLIAIIVMPVAIIPLLPIQILWINLVTNGIPALALGVDPPEKGIMKRKPRTEREGILSKRSMIRILAEGSILTIGALGAFAASIYWLDFSVPRIQTLVFTTLVFLQLIHSLNFRFMKKSVFYKETFNNRYLTLAIIGSMALQLIVVYSPFAQLVFRTVALGALEWLLIIGVVAIVEIVIDRAKLAVA